MKKLMISLCAAVAAFYAAAVVTVAAAVQSSFALAGKVFVAAAERPDTLMMEISGEVTEEGKLDRVLLFGKHPNKGFFTEGICIEVRDGATGESIAAFHPKIDAGYKPVIMLGAFTESRIQSIFLGIDSGGSGGFQYSYVFSAAEKKPATLWNFEQWNHTYEAKFRDGYRFTVSEKNSDLCWTIDLSDKSVEYLNRIYQEDGRISEPISGDVTGVTAAFPYFHPTTERYGLLIAQSVTGLCRADGYGYVQHLARWEDGAFRSYFTTYNFNGTLVTSS